MRREPKLLSLPAADNKHTPRRRLHLDAAHATEPQGRKDSDHGEVDLQTNFPMAYRVLSGLRGASEKDLEGVEDVGSSKQDRPAKAAHLPSSSPGALEKKTQESPTQNDQEEDDSFGSDAGLGFMD